MTSAIVYPREIANVPDETRTTMRVSFRREDIPSDMEKAESLQQKTIDYPVFRVIYPSSTLKKRELKMKFQVFLADDDDLSLRLVPVQDEEGPLRQGPLFFTLDLVTYFGIMVGVKRFSTASFAKSDDAWVWEKFGTKTWVREKTQMRVSTYLKIDAEITVIAKHTSNDFFSGDSGARALADEIKQPDLIGEFSDFAVVSGDGDRIPTFKVILAARSSVFRAMLADKKCREIKEGKVVIADFDTASLMAFVDFLVRDEIVIEMSHSKEESSAIIRSLLLLSDKYDVKKLRCKSTEWLASNLAVDTAIETVRVANTVRSLVLMNVCSDFIVENRSKFSSKVVLESKLPKAIMEKIFKKLWNKSCC